MPANLSEIIEALPNKSKLDKLLSVSPLDAKMLMDLLAYSLTDDKRRRQQSASNKKHALNQKARGFVRDLWQKNRQLYKSNKDFADFAGTMVLKQFNVSVKSETISRDWLSGLSQPTPSECICAQQTPRDFVISLWKEKQHLYKYKTDFSKYAKAEIFNKFDVTVKAETISSWLLYC